VQPWGPEQVQLLPQSQAMMDIRRG
jgi:hypothetical protein